MSEQMPQNPTPIDQTHDYNANAAEAIAAMPKDEQGLPVPDETAYNKSQAERDNPNLFNPLDEARRQEMEKWSDLTGKHTEKAAKQATYFAKRSLENGLTENESKDVASTFAKSVAKDGVYLYEKGIQLRAVEGGMLEKPDRERERLFRSPATMAKENQAKQAEVDQSLANMGNNDETNQPKSQEEVIKDYLRADRDSDNIRAFDKTKAREAAEAIIDRKA
jgi:hypothetical protein